VAPTRSRQAWRSWATGPISAALFAPSSPTRTDRSWISAGRACLLEFRRPVCSAQPRVTGCLFPELSGFSARISAKGAVSSIAPGASHRARIRRGRLIALFGGNSARSAILCRAERLTNSDYSESLQIPPPPGRDSPARHQPCAYQPVRSCAGALPSCAAAAQPGPRATARARDVEYPDLWWKPPARRAPAGATGRGSVLLASAHTRRERAYLISFELLLRIRPLRVAFRAVARVPPAPYLRRVASAGCPAAMSASRRSSSRPLVRSTRRSTTLAREASCWRSFGGRRGPRAPRGGDSPAGRHFGSIR